MIIGLTGMYCAGKNHIASLLEKRGWPVLDADKTGHEVINTLKDVIFLRFGDDIKNPDGTVNRRLLGKKVFGKSGEMAALEAIIHPEANRLIENQVAEQNGNCVINAALLHKTSFFGKLDCVIIVSAPWVVRLILAKRRDRLPLPALVKRLSSQKRFNSQYLAGNADIYKIGNPEIFKFGFLTDSVKNDERLERRIDSIISMIENRKPAKLCKPF